MRPEAKVQRRGDRSAPDFSWLFASSAMYVASLTGMTREKRNHIRHHQPQKPTVRESGVAPDRLVGLAGVTKSLVLKMEKDAALPPRMAPAELYRNLAEIGKILTNIVDHDICPWIAERRTPVGDETKMAAVVIADRLCGMAANPIIRNAQEQRQLDSVEEWLSERQYARIPPGDAEDPASMPSGSFSFRMNVEGWMDEHGVKTVKIPVDIVIKPHEAASSDLPLFVEAKSAGDFTNVNKRRKEEAAKAGQLRRRLGSRAQFILFLGGYFNSGPRRKTMASRTSPVLRSTTGNFGPA